MHIYPYSMASKSAKALANSLGCKLAKRGGAPLHSNLVINWGCAKIHRDIYGRFLNTPQAVSIAHNKHKTFLCLAGIVPVPEFTTKEELAYDWFRNGDAVVVRETLTGHSGEGIVLLDPEQAEDWQYDDAAPLYTRYIRKINEYRLHTSAEHGVFFIQRKARKKDVPDDQVNWKIRNHANGFIFAHQEVNVPEHVKDMCIRACHEIRLDFGAFDVIETKAGAFYILEVNTACGLEGTTLEKYTELMRRYV